MRSKRLFMLIQMVIAFTLCSCTQAPNSTPEIPTPVNNPPASPLITPQTKSFSTYRGDSFYGGTRNYEIDYDPSKWQVNLDPDSNPNTPGDEQLQNITDPNCVVALRSIAFDVTFHKSLELAGRQWKFASRVIPDSQKDKIADFIIYMTDAIDPHAGEIAYAFIVHLPSPYDDKVKSRCQQEAEVVINTFRIIE